MQSNKIGILSEVVWRNGVYDLAIHFNLPANANGLSSKIDIIKAISKIDPGAICGDFVGDEPFKAVFYRVTSKAKPPKVLKDLVLEALDNAKIGHYPISDDSDPDIETINSLATSDVTPADAGLVIA